MKFSNVEKRDLVFAGLLLSLAFAILFAGGYEVLFSFNLGVLFLFVIAFFTAGVGFLLHELMHKFVAKRYGYFAEFRAYYGGLWLALGFSLFGFILAAPGAVHIRSLHRPITREKNGKISVAGPVSNIVLSVVFLILILIFGSEGFGGAIFSYGLSINSLLAAFNLIPVRPFDGEAVKNWNLKVYVFCVVVAVGSYIASWFI